MENAVRKLRLVLVMLVLAVIAVLAYSAFPSPPAHAQAGDNQTQILKSAGPIQINNNGEAILIGLLLPAVQRVELPYHLQLFNSAGRRLVDIPVAALGDGSVRTAFFDVFFTNGSILVMDHATGKVLAEEQRSDGIFSAVLLPAVQRGGHRVGAISASIQILDANKQRGAIVGMCDGSV
jgi:hypothetical protein